MKLIGIPSGTQLLPGLAIGAAVVLIAPVVLPVIAGVVKSLAKAGIKGGLILFEKGKVAVAEAQETIEDLTAEAKAELSEEQEAEAPPRKKRAVKAAAK